MSAVHSEGQNVRSNRPGIASLAALFTAEIKTGRPAAHLLLPPTVGTAGAVWWRSGSVEASLTELRQSLEQFDAAMVSGAEARATHVRASAELRRLADEAVQGVKVLDRFNRVRFRGTPEVLAAWRSVSSTMEPSRGGKTEPESGIGSGGAPREGGEVRPAA